MKNNLNIRVLILVTAILGIAIPLIVGNDKESIIVARNPYEITSDTNYTDSIKVWIKDFSRQDIELAVNHINYLKEHTYSSDDVFTCQDIIDRAYNQLVIIDEKLLESGEYELAELRMISVRVAIGEREYWAPYRVGVTGATLPNGIKIYTH